MVGAHPVEELFEAVPFNLRIGEVVLLLDLMELQTLVLKQIGVQENAQGEVAAGVEVGEHSVGIVHAHEGGVNHADGGDAQGVCALGRLAKRSFDDVHRRVVYIVQEDGAGVVGEHTGRVAICVFENLAACGVRCVARDAHLVDGAGVGAQGVKVDLL